MSVHSEIDARTLLTGYERTDSMYTQSRGAKRKRDSPPRRPTSGRPLRGSRPKPGRRGTARKPETLRGVLGGSGQSRGTCERSLSGLSRFKPAPLDLISIQPTPTVRCRGLFLNSPVRSARLCDSGVREAGYGPPIARFMGVDFRVTRPKF